MSDTSSEAAHPTLVVMGGPMNGQTLTVEHAGVHLLGSGATCAMRIELSGVAPLHARIVRSDSGITITDAGSSTGTYVNGEQIEGEQTLVEGDRIYLGTPGSSDSAKIVSHLPEQLLPMLPELPPAEVEPEPVMVEADSDARPAGHRATKEDYSSDMPSIASDRPREAPSVPATPTSRPKAAPKSSSPLAAVPQPALIGGAAVLALIVAFAAYRMLHRAPPVLESILPPAVEPGQGVKIAGTGFDANTAKDVVRFGTATGTITSASTTELAVNLPEIAVAGAKDVPVVVEVRGRKSNTLQLKIYRRPHVAALEPDVAMPDEEVSLTGQYLAGKDTIVRIGGLTAEVIDSSASGLRIRIPSGLPQVQGKSYPVTATVGTETSKPVNMLLGRLPLVAETSPTRGAAGIRVVVKGRGFDPSAAGNTVFFGPQQALVLQAAPNEITVLVPAVGMDAQAQVPVNVAAKGKASSSEITFSVSRPASSYYVPRFHAAIVGGHESHDHAFVSTELGPLLLLSGKAEAASTSERAEQAATAINAAFDAALQGKPVAFEVRDKPAPGVGLAGNPAALLTVTAADAAGYDEGWDPSSKARHSNLKVIATYWTALLQDYLTIFALHQRPSWLLELSPRGRALPDLFAQAGRAGSTASGIPMAFVRPLSAAAARNLRELSLFVPAEVQAHAGAAVEGTWEGVMAESDSGDRPITVRLQLNGNQLAGSLTTRSGKLGVEVPLRDASYERGSLKFTAVLRGSPRGFVGTVDGQSVTGTILSAPGSKDVVGRFSLRYTE